LEVKQIEEIVAETMGIWKVGIKEGKVPDTFEAVMS
jgi:hypothetical protein